MGCPISELKWRQTIVLMLILMVNACNGWQRPLYLPEQLALCSRMEAACQEVDSDCLALMDDVGSSFLPCSDEYRKILAQGGLDCHCRSR